MTNMVDRLAGASSALAQKAPCRLATTANVTLSGFFAVDGVLPTTSQHEIFKRILVKSQADASENGIYVMSATAWQRAKDFDSVHDFVEGTRLYVFEGTTSAGAYVVSSNMDPDTFDIGTDDIEFIAAATVDISIGSLTELAVPDPDADFISIFDTSASQNKKVKPETLAKYNSDGTAALPAVAFESDLDSGIYRPAANQVGVSLGGALAALFATSGLTLGVAGTLLGTLALAGNTSGATTLTPAATASGTLTLPAATDTLVGRATTDTLTNKTLTSPVVTLPQINDTSADHQYVFAVSELAADRTVTLPLLLGNDTFVFADFIQTLTNKTLASPVLTTPQINDTSADHQYVFAVSELAADRTVTLPLLAGNDTFVFEAFAATLTNKTVNLASNTLTGTLAEFNTALSDANFASLAGAETLTNKVIAIGSNTVSGSLADFNNALTGADFATLAGSESLTNKTISGAANTITNIGTASILDENITLAKLEHAAAYTLLLRNAGTTGDPAYVKISALTDRAAFGSGDKLMIEESTGELRKIDYNDLPGAGAGLSNVVEDVTPQLGGDLDANTFNIDFDDNTGIRDDASNEQLIFQKTASAVAYLEITNAATGNSPTLAAKSSDSNADLVLEGQGTGTPRVSAINGGQLAGFRNAIINGAMMIAQRGAAFTSVAPAAGANNDDVYVLDRWNLLSDGNDIVDVTQTTTAPTGGLNSIGLDVETVDKKFGILQVIEQKNCIGLIGNTVTLSAQLKVTNATRLDKIKMAIIAWSSTADTVTSDIVSAWGVDGTNPTLVANWTYENTPADLGVTTSWARYSVSAAVDTASTTNIGVFIWSDNVTDTDLGDFLHITDVQLEIGSVPTTFERRTMSTEVALCQRYYQTSGTGAVGQAINTTVVPCGIRFLAAMRVAPTGSSIAAATTDLSIAGSTSTITGTWAVGLTTTAGALIQFTRTSGTFTTGDHIIVHNATESIALAAEM